MPIGIAAMLLANRLLAESRGTERGRLDIGGAVLLIGGVAAFSVALTDMDLVWFWRFEGRHDAPLVRFALLRVRGVWSGNVVMALVAGTTGAALFFAKLYLMQVGAAFAPVTVIVLAVSPYAGRLVGRVGARALMVTGTLVSLAGLVHLSFVDASGSYVADVLPGLAAAALLALAVVAALRTPSSVGK